MRTSTPSGTEPAHDAPAAPAPAATATSLSVTRPGSGGGRLRILHRAEGGPGRPVIRPVVLSSDATRARVSLVPEGALLLAGDVVRLDISVGAGATVELVEPAGTVAYDMRGGAASWDVRIRVASTGRLVWHGEPFVVSAGADVRRHTAVTLGAGARLALRETLVLGRHGEPGGLLDQRLEAVDESGRPLVVDAFDTRVPALAWGHHRAQATVLLLGVALPHLAGEAESTATREVRFELEEGGTLVRSLTDAAHAAELRASWRAAVAAVTG